MCCGRCISLAMKTAHINLINHRIQNYTKCSACGRSKHLTCDMPLNECMHTRTILLSSDKDEIGHNYIQACILQKVLA